ncbi:DUF2207 domain-containing protein [Granulicoccus sp. GXG6511]|uniref:DUF2207 domain-containing protein n=1 Tax=Granulicoccus sp. GXG6511 TaxID=3381351 RepID=UPI003D7D112F
MKQTSTRVVRGLVLLALALGLFLGLGSIPAHAVDQAATHITSATVNSDGSLDVRSTMRFDGAPPAEVVQRLRVKEEVVGERDYLFTVSDLRATANGRDIGRVSEESEHVVLTMAPEGAEEVVVTYRVTGAAVRAAGDQTLVRWDILQGLSIPVQQVEGEITVPGQFTDFKCVAGAPGTQTACALASGGTHESFMPVFTDGPRGAGEIVGPRITFPASVVAPNEEIDERWTVGRAFSGTGWPLAAALVALAVGALGIYLLHRKAGRDAHPGGDPIEVARFESVGDGRIEFQPGGEVLPGEVGTVVDERVDPIDITATILDLAVHGHLLIAEQPRRSEFAPTDWEIIRLDAGRRELRPYEQDLLDAVVPKGERTLVSAIGPAVAGAIPQIQSDLYDEVVAQGFYDQRPDSTRNVWNTAAMTVIIAGIVVTGLLAAFTTFGLAGLAVIAIGLGLAFVAQEMPARTAEGARLLAGLDNLRGQLLAQPTDQMPKGREYRELSEVLPYAIVLGGADRWLEAIATADDDDLPDPTDLEWYNAPDNWHLRDLPDSLRNFITTLNGQLFAR